MAIGSSVPPRAYTREILTTAFNWLQSQPDFVRTKATTPDALVGLYMQAQRGGTTATAFEADAPVSSQEFMSDLKNLAKGVRDFDEKFEVPNVTRTAHTATAYVHTPVAPAPADSVKARVPSPQLDFAPSSAAPAPVAAPPSMTLTGAAESMTPPNSPLLSPQAPATSALNERSVQMLREVRATLNLSSDTEALNMMIALAHRSLKSLLA